MTAEAEERHFPMISHDLDVFSQAYLAIWPAECNEKINFKVIPLLNQL